jgi:hypothetical protein
VVAPSVAEAIVDAVPAYQEGELRPGDRARGPVNLDQLLGVHPET